MKSQLGQGERDAEGQGGGEPHVTHGVLSVREKQVSRFSPGVWHGGGSGGLCTQRENPGTGPAKLLGAFPHLRNQYQEDSPSGNTVEFPDCPLHVLDPITA